MFYCKYLDRSIVILQNFFSKEKFEKYSNTIFSLPFDVLFFIVFSCAFICSIYAEDTGKLNSQFIVPLSASLITITILLNAHICKSHIFDTSTEGLQILGDLQYVENTGGDWENLGDKRKTIKELREIRLEVRTLLLMYNIRIIVMWCVFILSQLVLHSLDAYSKSTIWIFCVLYILYTIIILVIMYHQDKNVGDCLNNIYKLTYDYAQSETL